MFNVRRANLLLRDTWRPSMQNENTEDNKLIKKMWKKDADIEMRKL